MKDNKQLKEENMSPIGGVTTSPSSTETAVANLYGGSMKNAGTEEVTTEDLNIPYLVLLQRGTEIPELGADKKVGFYYRTDTQEQSPAYDVNLVYVTNEKKTDQKTGKTKYYKSYFGFYAGTTEPVKLRMRGWGMAAHKQLQTEISMYKQRYEVPMFALTIRLTSENKKGLTAENEAYDVEKIVCEVLKDPTDPKKPLIEQDHARVAFLYEAINRFKAIAPLVADEDSEPEA